jgi:hypothetical protein
MQARRYSVASTKEIFFSMICISQMPFARLAPVELSKKVKRNNKNNAKRLPVSNAAVLNAVLSIRVPPTDS